MIVRKPLSDVLERLHEEPIVCTPNDALRAFRDGNLDYLAIGNFIVTSPNA